MVCSPRNISFLRNGKRCFYCLVNKGVACLLLAACLMLLKAAQAQVTASGRTSINLSKDWFFTKDIYQPNIPVDSQKINWQPISLPHTWNATDVMDDTPGYYRGVCWYRKVFTVNEALLSKELYLHFEGANQLTEVYVNGKKAGGHTGGYTAFDISINACLRKGKSTQNELLVKVDNRYNEAVPPLTADFTFYGGIYRQVSLLALSRAHFATDAYGATGVQLTTPMVSAATATLIVRGRINTRNGTKTVVQTTLYNARQEKIGTASTQKNINGIYNLNLTVKAPQLWSPEQPYLYWVVTEIRSATTGEILDQVTNKVGFRWYRFSADSGFFLNGKPYKLVGTSRHQDYQGMGNAVSKELACRDVQLLKEMGGNFLRVAHYPQDPCVLDACDSLGILASVEIPVVNEITESEAFYTNCRHMMQEMIGQNGNHTSVIIWCSMNEVLLRPHFNNDKARQTTYFTHIKELAQSLDSIARANDPYRYTMIACHGDFDKYRSIGLTAIPMLVGWNLYSGWYSGNLAGLPDFLDKHHRLLPDKPLLLTEYGADADARIRSEQPQRFDKSVDYAVQFHQYYLQQVMQRPFVAGAIIWNLADFNSESREESLPHINTKGLLTWNRQPKEVYRFYQAALHGQPYQPDTLAAIKPALFSHLRPADHLNILLGAKRRFWDDSLQQWWIPDTPFQNSNDGPAGGRSFHLSGNTQLPYGTNKSIAGTDKDPVYQTQQIGLTGYHLSVPNGHYQLQLHFAELGTTTAQPLAYNLSGDAATAASGQRIFDVYINDSLLLSHFNIAKEYGAATAVEISTATAATADKGITISFKAIEGEPVLNALQLKRMD